MDSMSFSSWIERLFLSPTSGWEERVIDPCRTHRQSWANSAEVGRLTRLFQCRYTSPGRRPLLRYLTAYESVVSEILVGTHSRAGYVAQNLLESVPVSTRGMRAYLVVGIDLRDAPSTCSLIHTHPSELFARIVDAPKALLPLLLLLLRSPFASRLIHESVQLLDPCSRQTCSG